MAYESLPIEPLREIAVNTLDPNRYDFDGLRADVMGIIEVGPAVVSTLKWTILVPIIGFLIAHPIFSGRMSGVVYVFFAGVLILLLVVAAVVLGVLLTLRQRLASTNEAAARVVSTVSLLHADVMRVKSGGLEVPMRDVARMLTAEIVFPALTGGVGTMLTTAGGPVGWLGSKVLGTPMRMLEDRVLEALDHDDVLPTAYNLEPASRHAAEAEAPHLVAAALTPDGLPDGLAEWYHGVMAKLMRVVSGLGTVATGTMMTLLGIALVPLLTWMAFGWFVL